MIRVIKKDQPQTADITFYRQTALKTKTSLTIFSKTAVANGGVKLTLPLNKAKKRLRVTLKKQSKTAHHPPQSSDLHRGG